MVSVPHIIFCPNIFMGLLLCLENQFGEGIWACVGMGCVTVSKIAVVDDCGSAEGWKRMPGRDKGWLRGRRRSLMTQRESSQGR